MIARSYNGWIASPDPKRLNVTTITVAGRRFTVVKVAAPLFAYLIRRFDAEVDPLMGGILDEWSYNYRPIRGGGSLSCHASATAVDLDATQFPMGTSNMTKQQRANVERILKACRKQFRWGGHFSMPRTDEMHFELASGTSAATVQKAIAEMRLHGDGRVLQPADLGPDGDPQRIKLLKAALAAVDLHPKRVAYTGKWTPRVASAWSAWTLRKPKQGKQARLDALGAASHLF